VQCKIVRIADAHSKTVQHQFINKAFCLVTFFRHTNKVNMAIQKALVNRLS